MRYDTKIDYFDEEKTPQGHFIGAVTDLGAEKANNLFGDMKQQQLFIQSEKPLGIRSGFFKCNHGNYQIVKASLNNLQFYCEEYDGRL